SLSTDTKFNHALRTAACIARLLLGHRDPVGLASWDANGDGLIVKPRSTPCHFEALFSDIVELTAGGETHLKSLVMRLIPLFPQRMRIILLSDGFMDADEMEEILQALSVRGHEVIFGHVLAPEEVNFNFENGTRFEDLETPDSYRDIDPAVYREAYLTRFNAFLEEIQAQCTKLGCGYFRLVSSDSAGASFAAFLRRWNAGNYAPVLGPDQKISAK
ncbi:MAG: hypothetical protein KAG66_14375, partial [Methylococcales bacterium]|nr:hypothetical protein [Methylococcales bacterium]